MKKIVIILLILTFICVIPNSYGYCNDILMPIMGEGTLDSESMYMYLLLNNDIAGINPISEEYAKNFVNSIIKYSKDEGVNHDVVFALIMHETGFLNFGGDVLAEQNNFGGLGTTGGGVQGAYFDTMDDGILAVIQHLKCYASSEPLSLPCKDPRWSDTLREKAVFVEYLGYNDNPNGAGWAVPGDGYGERLKNKITESASIDKDSAKVLIAQREQTLAASATVQSQEAIPIEEISPAKKIEKYVMIFLLLILFVLFVSFIKVKSKMKKSHIVKKIHR